MENHDKGPTITLPHEFAPLLTIWAATAILTVDELVTQLLADALKIKTSDIERAISKTT